MGMRTFHFADLGSLKASILTDIFGSKATKEKRLMDSYARHDFLQSVDALYYKWDTQEKGIGPRNNSEFSSYFRRQIEKGMILPVRWSRWWLLLLVRKSAVTSSLRARFARKRSRTVRATEWTQSVCNFCHCYQPQIKEVCRACQHNCDNSDSMSPFSGACRSLKPNKQHEKKSV